MVVIEVPENMIIDHVNWHSKRPEDGGRNISRGQKGSGEEFLVWHKWFIARYNRWRKRSGKPILEPWSEIPSELNLIYPKFNPPNPRSFDTLDGFGIFLEDGVHGILHDKAALVYDEPILRTLESPRSSYFWQLHGLVNNWRKSFEKIHRYSSLNPVWCSK